MCVPGYMCVCARGGGGFRSLSYQTRTHACEHPFAAPPYNKAILFTSPLPNPPPPSFVHPSQECPRIFLCVFWMVASWVYLVVDMPRICVCVCVYIFIHIYLYMYTCIWMVNMFIHIYVNMDGWGMVFASLRGSVPRTFGRERQRAREMEKQRERAYNHVYRHGHRYRHGHTRRHRHTYRHRPRHTNRHRRGTDTDKMKPQTDTHISITHGTHMLESKFWHDFRRCASLRHRRCLRLCLFDYVWHLHCNRVGGDP